MYGSDKWVITSWNFLQFNILMGLSKTFGEEPWTWYLNFMIPINLTILTPFAYYAIGRSHWIYQYKNKTLPYISIYVIFYLFFFSIISHKEIRFMLPIWSFILITVAELWNFGM
jgi:phosphatidylinositol glycan class B